MAGPRTFVSFDYDHDEMLRMYLVGQSRNERTPFELTDWSVKEPMSGDWKEKVRERIRKVDKVLVICGEHTDTAAGVSAEVRIAREEGKPLYFLRGHPNKNCKFPKAALPGDRMIPWTWDALAIILSKPKSPTSREPFMRDRVRPPREHFPRERGIRF